MFFKKNIFLSLLGLFFVSSVFSSTAFARGYVCAANCGWWERIEMDAFTCSALKNRAWVNGKNTAVACSRFIGDVEFSEGKTRKQAFKNLQKICEHALWDDDNFRIKKSKQIRKICQRD